MASDSSIQNFWEFWIKNDNDLPLKEREAWGAVLKGELPIWSLLAEAERWSWLVELAKKSLNRPVKEEDSYGSKDIQAVIENLDVARLPKALEEFYRLVGNADEFLWRANWEFRKPYNARFNSKSCYWFAANISGDESDQFFTIHKDEFDQRDPRIEVQSIDGSSIKSMSLLEAFRDILGREEFLVVYKPSEANDGFPF